MNTSFFEWQKETNNLQLLKNFEERTEIIWLNNDFSIFCQFITVKRKRQIYVKQPAINLLLVQMIKKFIIPQTWLKYD